MCVGGRMVNFLAEFACSGNQYYCNLAAHTSVVESVENPRLNFDVNVKGTFKGVNIMKTVEYAGRILKDGHLSLPDAIRKSFGLKIDTPVKVTLTLEYNHQKHIAEDAGFDTGFDTPSALNPSRTQPKDFGELVAEGYQNAAVGEQEPSIAETAIPKPLSPYGASKLACEAYCSAF